MASWRRFAWVTLLAGCGGDDAPSEHEDATSVVEVGTSSTTGTAVPSSGTMQDLVQTAMSGDGSTTDEAATEEGSSGAAGEESTGAEETGGEPETTDFFACGFAPACDPVVDDGMPEPLEAARCVADLAESGRPVVVEWTEIPRDATSVREIESWILLLGDGTAVVQSRALLCLEDYAATGDEECEVELEWSPPQDPLRCEVLLPSDACEEACPEGEDCACAWNPSEGVGLANCLLEEEAWPCDAVADLTAD